MEPRTLLALTKFNDNDVRDAMDEGTYEIDEIVRIQGSMKIQADHESITTAAIPWMKVLALALSKLNGVTIESLVKEALEADDLGKEIKDRARVAMNKLKDSTVGIRRGAVKVNLDVSTFVPQ